jgi:hypothetical protein
MSRFEEGSRRNWENTSFFWIWYPMSCTTGFSGGDTFPVTFLWDHNRDRWITISYNSGGIGNGSLIISERVCQTRIHLSHTSQLPPPHVCVFEPERECLAVDIKHTDYGGYSFCPHVQVEWGEVSDRNPRVPRWNGGSWVWGRCWCACYSVVRCPMGNGSYKDYGLFDVSSWKHSRTKLTICLSLLWIDKARAKNKTCIHIR